MIRFSCLLGKARPSGDHTVAGGADDHHT